VPIDGIMFGGRRAGVVPLVREAFDWSHGVFMGSIMSSETTAAAFGEVGKLRFDPFAMLPFCGYNMADYWGHWLKIGTFTDPANLPRIYAVNWFRKDADGAFMWPGFGENSRVLEWIIQRLDGEAGAVDTAIGRVPAEGSLDFTGLDMSAERAGELFAIDPVTWLAESDLTEEYFDKFGDRVPAELRGQLAALRERLQQA
jgi:phosphoenolpyruvate carboxykinase (GTP)